MYQVSSPDGAREREDMMSTGWPEAALQVRGFQTDAHRSSNTDGLPKSFHDILPPELITTSTLSEAAYMGYRKSRFKSLRSSTVPASTTSKSQLGIFAGNKQGDQLNVPSRRSTIKKMQGVMHSIRRSVTSFKAPKPKNRPPIPTSSGFGAGFGRFGNSRRTKRAQGYQDVGSDDSDGEGGEN